MTDPLADMLEQLAPTVDEPAARAALAAERRRHRRDRRIVVSGAVVVLLLVGGAGLVVTRFDRPRNHPYRLCSAVDGGGVALEPDTGGRQSIGYTAGAILVGGHDDAG